MFLSIPVKANPFYTPVAGQRKKRKLSSILFQLVAPLLLLLITINQVPNAQAMQQITPIQPTFIKDMNLMTVRENTPVGELVYTLEAQLDTGRPGDQQVRLQYTIEGTNLFSVDKWTGQVRIARPIDREQTSDSIEFQVSATPVYTLANQQQKLFYGPPAQLSITVLVLDENDNPPRIDRVKVGRQDYDYSALMRHSFGGSPGYLSSLSPTGGSVRVPLVRLNVSEETPVESIIIDLIESFDVDKASSSPLRSICLDCDPEFELRSSSNTLLNDQLNSTIVLVNPLVHVPQNNLRYLHVIVNDGKFNATIMFEIFIEDVQNKPPQFVGSSTCIVQENAPIDRTIMTILAIDGDAIGRDGTAPITTRGVSQMGRQILYDLVNLPGQPASLLDDFKLHPLTGQLQIANRIDRESYLSQEGVVSLRVRARELIQSVNSISQQEDFYASILERLASYTDPSPDAMSEFDVSIIIVDTNDNEPRWLNASEISVLNMNQSPNWFSNFPNDQDTGRIYEIQVKENLLPGSSLTSPNEMLVYDLDSGDNAIFNLTIMDPFNLFEVEPKQVSGFALVSLKLGTGNSLRRSPRMLDYENLNERNFIIQLKATEMNTNDHFSSTAQVRIKVLDVNDNTPEFKQSAYHGSVREDAPAGEPIIQVQASDKDEVSQQLFYTIHGKSAHLFNMNRFTGLLTIAKCSAEQMLSGGRQQISQPSMGRSQCLDYETQRLHHLMVEVSDGELSSKIPLTISIEDASDNGPVFLIPIVDVVIEEGAEKIDPPIKVEAFDADQSSIISYSIIEGNQDGLFAINNATGELYLRRPVRILHEEAFTSIGSTNGTHGRIQTGSKINLVIRATDGLFASNCSVRIDVLDANDNAPKFLRTQYSAEIQESSMAGQPVATVRAIDSDRGNNARVSYRLQRGTFGQFEIDEATGIIIVAGQAEPFDTSKRDSYTLEVVAYDHGLVSKSSTVLVNVRVLDTRREAPQFEPKIQRISVPESVSNSTMIHRMTVAHDQPAGSLLVFEPGPIEALDKNGQPVTMTDGNNGGIERLESMFSVSTNTGDVVVNSALDHDFAAYINLTVYVSTRQLAPAAPDAPGDAPSMEEFWPRSVGYLIINVLDDNSNAPVFAAPWSPLQPELSFQMLEELPVGSILTQLVAADPDSRISHFRIEPANEYFELSSTGQPGTIVNKRLIDYDSLMSQTFLKPRSLNLTSNFGLGQQPGAQPSGSNEGNNIIQFNVYVYDSGLPQLSAKAVVSVEILPVNDVDCRFEQSTYEARIKENAPPDTLLVQVRAIDLDYGEQHNTVRYQLVGPNSNLFNMDAQTGLITVSRKRNAQLDRERLSQANFTLTVIGTDSIDPVELEEKQSSVPGRQQGRSCWASIKVHVEDINDNPPLFIQKLYDITAYDTDTVEVPLLRLLVRDEDVTKSNQQLSNNFRILSGNTNDIFNITSTGVVYATKPLGELLLHSSGSSYIQLRVQVKQQSGSSSLAGPNMPVVFTDECLVRIQLFKINRFGPEWSFEPGVRPSSLKIEENATPGSHVTQLKCNDRDIEHHLRNSQAEELTSNPIRYWIKLNGSKVSETPEFKLDSRTGNLSSRIELDRERKDQYQLVVVCDDNGKPESMENVIQISINIIDVDDNLPEFLISRSHEIFRDPNELQRSKARYMVGFAVEENQGKGLQVAELHAFDRDYQTLFPISYCLIEGNDFQEFALDNVSGILYTNQTLDREKQSSYDLLVKAINDGSNCKDHVIRQSPIVNDRISSITQFRGSNAPSEQKDSNLLAIRVDVLDINDNVPTFKKPLFRTAIHHKSLINTLITQVSAQDQDSGSNGTLSYEIKEIYLHKISPTTNPGQQHRTSARNDQSSSAPIIAQTIKLVQFPFRIDQQGNIYTQQLLTQRYHLMSVFVLKLEAKEQAEPFRTAHTTVEIYVFETNSQLRIQINLHPRLVETYRSEIESLLSNATGYAAIINRARSYDQFQSDGGIQSSRTASTRTSTNQDRLNQAEDKLSLPSEPGSRSNIHLIFVENFRLVNPNLVMEKFDRTSEQLFIPQTLTKDSSAKSQSGDVSQISISSVSPDSVHFTASSSNQKSVDSQQHLSEVASLIDKIALASTVQSEYPIGPISIGSSSMTGIDWLEGPAAIYVTITIMLVVFGFVIFLFGCCCTSRIKDHIVRVAMDKLVKQQNLQAKINEQVLSATNCNGNQMAAIGRSSSEFANLNSAGYMSAFDTTKGCIANNNENLSILQRALDSGEYIEPHYATMNGHVNMGAHYYDTSELDHHEDNIINQNMMDEDQILKQHNPGGSLSLGDEIIPCRGGFDGADNRCDLREGPAVINMVKNEAILGNQQPQNTRQRQQVPH